MTLKITKSPHLINTLKLRQCCCLVDFGRFARLSDLNISRMWRALFNVNAPGLLRDGVCKVIRISTTIADRGLKRHVAVHRRCEDCRIVRPHGRLMVQCDKHPRHNQLQFGRPGQYRIHRVYPWRWPDPFEKKYSHGPFYQDRYLEAFSKD